VGITSTNKSGLSTGNTSSEVSIAGPLTAFGDLRVAELNPLFQLSFEYTVDNTATIDAECLWKELF